MLRCCRKLPVRGCWWRHSCDEEDAPPSVRLDSDATIAQQSTPPPGTTTTTVTSASMTTMGTTK